MKNLILLVCLTTTLCSAQNYDADSVLYTPLEKPNSKKINLVDDKEGVKQIEYFFYIQTGALIGCNDCHKGKDVTFSLATTHGVTIGKKLRGGLGMGFDSYANWQTLPLYGMISWDLIGNKNKNAVFLQMTYGWAHPWFVRDGIYNNYIYNNYTYDPFTGISGGRMINPSIGYRLKYHEVKMTLALAYKFQRIFYRQQNYSYCDFCSTYSLQFIDITQDMNRVQVIMSVGWK